MSDLPAVLEQTGMAVPESEVLDADYRVAVERPYPDPVHRSRSVVVPAALAALAMFLPQFLVYTLLAWSTKP